MIGYVIILILVVAFFYAIYSKTVEKEKTEEKNKTKHGEIKGYHSNGKLHYISNWNNGIQHGPIESYDEQGNLIKKSNLVNGEYQGEQIEYYPSGAIKIKRIYKNDEIVEEEEYDLLGNLKDKLDDENPAHITQMYLLRDKLNASKNETEFNSRKQELINLIKEHSPKDSSGKHVSIAFIKDGEDMLDGIILSDIEALKFHARILMEPKPTFNVQSNKDNLLEFKKTIILFEEKMNDEDINPWYNINVQRSKSIAQISDSTGPSINDIRFWGQAHASEYLSRMGSDVPKNDPQKLFLKDINLRIKAFAKISSELGKVIEKAKELNLEVPEEIHNDFFTAQGAWNGAQIAKAKFKAAKSTKK